MSEATVDVTAANNVTVVFNNEKSFPMYLRDPQWKYDETRAKESCWFSAKGLESSRSRPGSLYGRDPSAGEDITSVARPFAQRTASACSRILGIFGTCVWVQTRPVSS